MDTSEQLDWEAFLEFEVDDFFMDAPPPSLAVGSSPDPVLSEIENLLMDDEPAVLPSESEDYDKLLAEILAEPHPHSDNSRVEPPTPEEASNETVSKKQIRQMRNRDSAVKSRERKKLYVKNLEMKSRYYEGECRRLAHLLQCCYAENSALRLCLQSRGAFGASMTMQESAVLLLESLLLGSLLWFMGTMCQLSLPLILWLTVVLLRENMEQKDLRRVARKGPGSKISEYFLMESFVRSRRCRASRTKMKFDFFNVL
ncbi:bZIP transcription factor 60 [Lotus japonicus]|uniref:bZIP transcription factor 60 n=1 Tax=Lotus japonicus TaxID=34305 RepID=UPI00258CEBD8|nr:bZIP transcription factor 60 [Lotus japonicus]